MDRRPPVAIALAAIALVAVAGSVGLGAATTDRVLVVEDAANGDRLLTVPVDDTTTVTLAYTHSVERTPVEDVYAVNGTRLDNTLMRFQSYGWGLPAGADVTLRDGWFVYDPDRSFEELHVKPGHVAGHRLTVDGTTYDLVALSNATAVRIAVEPRTPHSVLQFAS